MLFTREETSPASTSKGPTRFNISFCSIKGFFCKTWQIQSRKILKCIKMHFFWCHSFIPFCLQLVAYGICHYNCILRVFFFPQRCSKYIGVCFSFILKSNWSCAQADWSAQAGLAPAPLSYPLSKPSVRRMYLGCSGSMWREVLMALQHVIPLKNLTNLPEIPLTFMIIWLVQRFCSLIPAHLFLA